MRNVPFNVSDGTTTLCRVFIIELSDDRRFGFTDHDRALEFDSVKCAPMESADTETELGFGSDSGALRSVFDIDLDAASIRNGALDNAQLTEYIVDWSNPEDSLLLTRGRIGPVRVSGNGFEVDWLGLSTLLNRSTGRVFSRRCDAELGDARCGLDLASFPEGTVCPRTFHACKNQFGNSVNFRGFPYLLGDDVLQKGLHLTPPRDGGSRYGG